METTAHIEPMRPEGELSAQHTMKHTRLLKVQKFSKISIPKPVFEALGLNNGDTVEITLEYMSKESTFQMRVHEIRRVSIPKPVFEALGLTAGVEVQATIENI